MTNMLTVSSQRFQTKFGEISDIVKTREPVIITQYGRPTMMLISYNDDIAEVLRQYHAKKFVAFLEEQAKAHPPATDEELAEINRLIDEEREIIYQEKLKNNAK